MVRVDSDDFNMYSTVQDFGHFSATAVDSDHLLAYFKYTPVQIVKWQFEFGSHPWFYIWNYFSICAILELDLALHWVPNFYIWFHILIIELNMTLALDLL